MLFNLRQLHRIIYRVELGIYQLDEVRLRLLNALFLRRAKGLASLAMPLDTSSVRVKQETPVAFFVNCFNKVKRFFTDVNTSPPLPA